MRRCILLLLLVVPAFVVAKPDRPKDAPKSSGIFVLDDCDREFKGKQEYNDNLTLVDSNGKQSFRLSGFNNAQTIGSCRMVAADPVRKCVWVIENVAHRVRRFDLTGKETLAINGVNGSALAVDHETGNVWALAGDGTIHNGKVLVFDDKGKSVATYNISGFDIVYDRKAKAFWIAGKTLTKVTAAKGEILFSDPISTWCASSLDVDPKSGAAWVAVREHPQVAGSKNQLIKFDPNGKKLATIELGIGAFRVSVDPTDGGAWVACGGKSIKRFSSEGKSEVEYTVEAFAIQVDASGGDVWVVTPSELQRFTRGGEVTRRLSHAGRTSQAWIASLD